MPAEPAPPISPRQLRLQLLNIGKLADVPVVISSLPSPQKETAEVEWEYAVSFRRASIDWYARAFAGVKRGRSR